MSDRGCDAPGCEGRHHSHGYCSTHAQRLKRCGDLASGAKVNPDDRLEDAWWMAETGDGLTSAAQRLGLTVNALEKWLERNDKDCLARLIANEPKDHNRRVASGFSISDLTGLREKRRRVGA